MLLFRNGSFVEGSVLIGCHFPKDNKIIFNYTKFMQIWILDDNGPLRWLTTVLRDNKFPYVRVSCKQCSVSKNHDSNQGKPLNKMVSVWRFFLFRAWNPERFLKLLSFSSKERNVQIAFSKCLMSSLDTKCTSFSKYDSVYQPLLCC